MPGCILVNNVQSQPLVLQITHSQIGCKLPPNMSDYSHGYRDGWAAVGAGQAPGILFCSALCTLVLCQTPCCSLLLFQTPNCCLVVLVQSKAMCSPPGSYPRLCASHCPEIGTPRLGQWTAGLFPFFFACVDLFWQSLC